MESQVSFEDHTNRSLEEENTETDFESLDEDRETGSGQEEEGESLVGNAVERISAEISHPDVDLVPDLEVTHVEF